MLADIPGSGDGDHLLSEDIKRLGRYLDAVQLAGAHGANRRRALHELVAGERIEDALGYGAEPVAGAAHPLQQGRDQPRRPDVAHQVDVADIDAELERSRGDNDRDVAALQALLGQQARLPGQAAVVGGHLALAQPLAQLMGNAFDEAAGVDEDDRRPMGLHLGNDPLVDLVPQLVGRDRPQLLVWDVDGEVHRPPMADVDDRASSVILRGRRRLP